MGRKSYGTLLVFPQSLCSFKNCGGFLSNKEVHPLSLLSGEELYVLRADIVLWSSFLAATHCPLGVATCLSRAAGKSPSTNVWCRSSQAFKGDHIWKGLHFTQGFFPGPLDITYVSRGAVLELIKGSAHHKTGNYCCPFQSQKFGEPAGSIDQPPFPSSSKDMGCLFHMLYQKTELACLWVGPRLFLMGNTFSASLISHPA